MYKYPVHFQRSESFLQMKRNIDRSLLNTLWLAAATVFMVIMIIRFPSEAFQASLQGLNIWWEVIFPALLPVFVLTEMLAAFGVVHALGVWIQPFMRFFFRIPGIGGWAFISGCLGGYPAGAHVTGNLRRNRLISRGEGERLLALSHLANPVWMLAAVGVGFFHQAEIGLFLFVVQLVSVVASGIIMRFLPLDRRKNQPHAAAADQPILAPNEKSGSLWRRSLAVMVSARELDGRAFGKLMGDAVTLSVERLFLIGGFMMIFSVIIRILDTAHLLSWLGRMFEFALVPLGWPDSLTSPAIYSLFEVNLGAHHFSQANAPMLLLMCVISAALAWSGFAVHAQVKAAIVKTDMRYSVFVLSRMLHALTAIAATALLWKPLQKLLFAASPVFRTALPDFSRRSRSLVFISEQWLKLWIPGLLSAVCFLLIAILFSAFIKQLKAKHH